MTTPEDESAHITHFLKNLRWLPLTRSEVLAAPGHNLASVSKEHAHLLPLFALAANCTPSHLTIHWAQHGTLPPGSLHPFPDQVCSAAVYFLPFRAGIWPLGPTSIFSLSPANPVSPEVARRMSWTLGNSRMTAGNHPTRETPKRPATPHRRTSDPEGGHGCDALSLRGYLAGVLQGQAQDGQAVTGAAL